MSAPRISSLNGARGGSAGECLGRVATQINNLATTSVAVPSSVVSLSSFLPSAPRDYWHFLRGTGESTFTCLNISRFYCKRPLFRRDWDSFPLSMP
jgi:hypothetical protein